VHHHLLCILLARASFLNLNDNNADPIIQRIEIIENVTIKGSSSILYPRFVELEIASIIETKIRTSDQLH